jgi:hypothetical protein
MNNSQKKVLIAGWFSFDLPHNTAGDLLAQESAVRWATEAGYSCKIAVPNPVSPQEITTSYINPRDYDAVVFVCGPLTKSHIRPFMQQFSTIKRIALNVSVVPTSDLSDEFDVIIPRDTDDITNPDISLASSSRPVPVIGLIYVGKQKEYPSQQHETVEKIVHEVLGKVGAATVRIDTRLPHNEYGLSSISQIESTIQHMDIVITTRLHGAVLSLRNNIPPIAIDSVPGGAKVMKQMKALDWPLTYSIDRLDEEKLEQAIHIALTKQSRNLTTRKVKDTLNRLTKIESLFVNALAE